LTDGEVTAVLAEIQGLHALMVKLLYGTGMRLIACVMLRVKDFDFGRREIIIGDAGSSLMNAIRCSLARHSPTKKSFL
jgi:integrase